MAHETQILHATTVAIDGKAVVIIGPSGSGKSSLALQLIGLGAGLVADDRTQITLDGQAVVATVPSPIAGNIEARGVGILNVAYAGPTPVGLVIDLSVQEEKRLPEPHTYRLLGVEFPCLHHAPSSHFVIAIWLYVQGSLDITHD